MSRRKLAEIDILIVDDDEDILGSMELALRSEGASTFAAIDGHDAISQWREHSPRVIVLDMMLPKSSGFLVLEELMGSDDPPIVVMVTANEGRRHMAYAKELGVAAYLTKPIPLQLLIDTIHDLLGGHAKDNDGTMESNA
ncbi:MAG: two-component system response regulator [Phycisphaerae bacterium]|nr:two-component system response regulator [Phycisphaerae bacterium]|tara:strand:- start:2042 stop:2461 length:420 start_codon:yes stop_codon:yes gene_type:complete